MQSQAVVEDFAGACFDSSLASAQVAVKSSKQHTAQQEPAGATKKRASPRKAPSSRPARGGSATGKRKHVNWLDNDDDYDDDDFKVVHFPWSAFPSMSACISSGDSVASNEHH